MRILERPDEIYAIRAGGSEGEQRAHDLVAGWLADAGLAIEVDPDGNLLGRRAGEGGELWIGSPLDPVPNGGRFDGVLGVLAAIEAVEQSESSRPLAVVAFRDEER